VTYWRFPFSLALLFVLQRGSLPASAQGDPLTVFHQYTAAESRNDVEGMLALLIEDATLQGTGLCTIDPCVGKMSIREELNRRIGANTSVEVASERVDGTTVTVRYAQRTADVPEPAERQINIGVVMVRDELIASILTSIAPRPAPLTLHISRLEPEVYIDRARGLVVLTEGCMEPVGMGMDAALRAGAESEIG